MQLRKIKPQQLFIAVYSQSPLPVIAPRREPPCPFISRHDNNSLHPCARCLNQCILTLWLLPLISSPLRRSEQGDLPLISFRLFQKRPFGAHGKGNVAAADSKQFPPRLHSQKLHHLFAQPDLPLLRNGHPAVKPALIGGKSPRSRPILPQGRHILQNMPQLGRLQQSLPGHTEPAGYFASGEQIYLSFPGNAVFLHRLSGELYPPVCTDPGSSKNKLSALIQLRISEAPLSFRIPFRLHQSRASSSSRCFFLGSPAHTSP